MDKQTKAYLDKTIGGLEKRLDARFDEFGRMVAEGFRAVDARFVGVDGRFLGIEKRLGGVEQRLDRVDYRLENLESAQVQTNVRVDKLTDHVDHFISLHLKVEQEILMNRAYSQRIEGRVEKLEAGKE